MASVFNLKGVHKDGKAELKIGLDKNAKIIDGEGNEIVFRNDDGTPAKISKENLPFIPDNLSEKNCLVTQEDLKQIIKYVNDALKSVSDAEIALNELSKIVGDL